MFMDLSKVFDTLNYNLLIAKLEVTFLEENHPLSFMKNNLSDRQQWVCTWPTILVCVNNNQLRLLFNIFINYLFRFVSNSYLSNYADDNIFYASGFNLEEVKNVLCTDFDTVPRWFY